MKVNQIITDQFIKCLTEGQIPWRKTWVSTSGFRNGFTLRPYRGVNTVTLSFLGKGAFYFTFKQITALGGKVKKGSKGIPIAFYTTLKQNEGTSKERTFPLLRYYKVFSFEDTEGMKWTPPVEAKSDVKPIDKCEAFTKAQNAVISYGSNRAVYFPDTHTISMPKIEAFRSAEDFYSTQFHELTHWCAKEVGEPLDSATFGSDPYAKEELVAEIGSAFCASFCGIRNDKVIENEKAYIQSWASKLKKDPQLIISAASKSQKRFDLMVKNFAPEAVTEEENSEE